jgi:hypothetical protein
MKNLVAMSLWSYSLEPLKFAMFMLCVLWFSVWLSMKEDNK